MGPNSFEHLLDIEPGIVYHQGVRYKMMIHQGVEH